MAEFNAQKVTKVDAGVVDGVDEAVFSVEGTDGGSFAIASSKKELKALMKSDADVVYDSKKGKLFLNDNGTSKGWGAKKVGGLLAIFKDKPELSAAHFDGLSAHGDDAITGDGDIKDQIALGREGLSDAEESRLYGETLINPKKGLKSIVKTGKKVGYKFNKAELGAALDEMNDAGAFSDIELDAAALNSLLNSGGMKQQDDTGSSGC